jgi:hypothetical protein
LKFFIAFLDKIRRRLLMTGLMTGGLAKKKR